MLFFTWHLLKQPLNSFEISKKSYLISNIKDDRTQDFQAPANCICEEKFYLWTNDIIISGHLFKGGLCCFFKKSTSISDYVHFYDSDSLLTILTTLFRKTKLNMHSLETTLATLIYIKISFITDCADNDDIQGNMKKSFITEFADYSVFNTRWGMISSLTTLTTLIFKTTLKIISHWLHWLHWFARPH